MHLLTIAALVDVMDELSSANFYFFLFYSMKNVIALLRRETYPKSEVSVNVGWNG